MTPHSFLSSQFSRPLLFPAVLRSLGLVWGSMHPKASIVGRGRCTQKPPLAGGDAPKSLCWHGGDAPKSLHWQGAVHPKASIGKGRCTNLNCHLEQAMSWESKSHSFYANYLKHNILRKRIFYEGYGNIIFPKLALGLGARFLQDASSKNVFRQLSSRK